MNKKDIYLKANESVQDIVMIINEIRTNPEHEITWNKLSNLLYRISRNTKELRNFLAEEIKNDSVMMKKEISVIVNLVTYHSLSLTTTVDASVNVLVGGKLFTEVSGEWLFDNNHPRGDKAYYEMLIKGAFE